MSFCVKCVYFVYIIANAQSNLHKTYLIKNGLLAESILCSAYV